MRFASAAKNTGANIINAGMAGGGSQFFEASRAAAPDYTGLANVIQDTRFDVAANEVLYKAKVKSSDITSDAQIKSDADILNSRSNAEKAVKKAGLLAAATGAGLKLFKKKKPPTEPAKVIPHEIATLPLEDIEALKATLKERYDKLRTSITTASGSTTGVVPASSHGGGGTISAQPGTPTETHTAYYNYLTGDKGLSRNKALGIMANISRESSFNPFSPSGDDNGAGGLFQYYDVRQTPEVEALVKAGDWKGQLDYALVDTVKRGETYLDTTFESAHQASDQWMRDYERPDDLEGGSKKHKTWLDTYGGGLGAT